MPVRLLHISDLHFTATGQTEKPDNALDPGMGEYFNRDAAGEFIKALKARLKKLSDGEAEWPKAIIVTGDLVERGGACPGEMEAAANFLKELARSINVPVKRVLIVPGNHDVNWAPGLTMAQRFENFAGAFSEFTTTRNTRHGPLPQLEEINLTGDIKLQIVLLVSPTFSGMANPDANRVFSQIENVLGDWSAEELARLRAALKTEYGSVDIAAIGENQIQFIRDSFDGHPKDPTVIRLAALHHHLLPDNQVRLSPFDSVLDAGLALETLIENGVDLVLSGHKHNRRLVHYSYLDDGSTVQTIDVFNGPSLFRGSDRSPSGFTLIELFGADSPAYAALEFCDARTGLRRGRRELMREGRVLRSVIEACSTIDPGHQRDLILPLVQNGAKVSGWLKERPAADGAVASLVETAWNVAVAEIDAMARRQLSFRPPDLHIRWRELLKAAQSENEPRLLLASESDIEFWWQAMQRPQSEAARYEACVRKFRGEKRRILILNRHEVRHGEAREQASKVVEWMEGGGVEICAILDSQAPDGEMDFGVVGEIAISQFRGNSYVEGRSLHESFDPPTVRSFARRWHTLREAPELWTKEAGDFSDWLQRVSNRPQ